MRGQLTQVRMDLASHRAAEAAVREEVREACVTLQGAAVAQWRAPNAEEVARLDAARRQFLADTMELRALEAELKIHVGELDRAVSSAEVDAKAHARKKSKAKGGERAQPGLF